MKYGNKSDMNIMLSPAARQRIDDLHKNAVKIYGKDCSRSAIIESLIMATASREDQLTEEIRKCQQRICQLNDERNVLRGTK